MAIKISFQLCKIVAQNCTGADTITADFTFTDASANTGTVRLIGSKNVISAIDDVNYLEVDGVSETTSIPTAFGQVTVEKNFNAPYNVEENITVSLHVTDCVNWENIEDALGCTNAIMTHQNNYLEDHEGNYLAFIT